MRDQASRKLAGCPSAADFAWWAERAGGMTLAELHGARLDCARTAKALDPHAIAGWYRDEGAAYITELRRRGWRPTLEGRP